MNLHVGNLSFETTTADLQREFAAFGEVSKANVITDRMTGQSRGFGFVEMSDQAAAQSAMGGLNGKEFHGRSWNVSEAKPRIAKPYASRSS